MRAALEKPCRGATSRLGTRSSYAMVVNLIRQAHGVVVAFMEMSLRCDSDKMIRGSCIPGAPSLRIATWKVNPDPDPAVASGLVAVAPLGHNPSIPWVTRGNERWQGPMNMSQPRRAGRPVMIRPTTRPRVGADRVTRAANAKRPPGAVVAAPLTRPTLETARRIAESVIIAVISSAGFFLVGSVYTDAYYGRLSIEVTSLDLAPPYVALQSIHALWGLLEYPLVLLLVYVLYRTLASPARRMGPWFAQARQRLPRLLPVLANLVVVAPLLLDALISFRERELPHRSVLTEVTSVLGYAGLALLGYVVWLGWSQRRFLVHEIRARKLVPIALVFLAYLLSALVTTGVVAELAAVELLTGDAGVALQVV